MLLIYEFKNLVNYKKFNGNFFILFFKVFLNNLQKKNLHKKFGYNNNLIMNKKDLLIINNEMHFIFNILQNLMKFNNY